MLSDTLLEKEVIMELLTSKKEEKQKEQYEENDNTKSIIKKESPKKDKNEIKAASAKSKTSTFCIIM